MTVELATAGRLKGDDAAMLAEALTQDLAEYPEQWVIQAIHKHRHASPFWPALSDLVKHMQPLIDERERSQAFERRHQAARTFSKSTAEAAPGRAEDRKAIVKARLGYDPESRRRVDKRAWSQECDARGVTPEQVAAMDAGDVCKTFIKSDKYDPKEMRASAKRIAAWMDKQNPEWRNAT